MSELLLVGQVAGERVAFRACDIQSVIEIDKVTPVPLAPPYVAGLAALRSRPLTVIDSACSLELAPFDPAIGTALKNAVVVELDRHLYALLVDAIEDVVPSESAPSPPPGALVAGWARCSLGLVDTPVGPLLLIDTRAIVAGPDRAEAA